MCCYASIIPSVCGGINFISHVNMFLNTKMSAPTACFNNKVNLYAAFTVRLFFSFFFTAVIYNCRKYIITFCLVWFKFKGVSQANSWISICVVTAEVCCYRSNSHSVKYCCCFLNVHFVDQPTANEPHTFRSRPAVQTLSLMSYFGIISKFHGSFPPCKPIYRVGSTELRNPFSVLTCNAI